MSILLALVIGILLGYFATRLIARLGLRSLDVIGNVLDGLTLTQLNQLRNAVDREVQTRIRQAEQEDLPGGQP